MAYCRWSTDDFQCDLYCYEDASGGYTTHVAALRHVYKTPLPPPIILSSNNAEEWFERYKKVQQMIGIADRVEIGLPCDGETFNDPDIESFIARIKMLREMGYKAPDDIEDRIRE